MHEHPGVFKMSEPMDLNVLGDSTDLNKIKDILKCCSRLGFGHVALSTSYTLTAQPKKSKNKNSSPVPCPLDLDAISDKKLVQGLKCHSRITVNLADPAHLNILRNDDIQRYDIVAAAPASEKLFQMACSNLEVDLITFDMTAKLPFKIKRQSVNEALRRGVFFEINYSPALKDSTSRRYTIGNAFRLMSVTKGKNVIISSQAESAIELRGPLDAANLGNLFGMKEAQCKASVTCHCRALLMRAKARKLRASKGAICVEPISTNDLTNHKNVAQDSVTNEQQVDNSGEEPATKRPKLSNNS